MIYFLAAAEGAHLDPMSHVLPHNLFGSSWFTNIHLMTLVVMILGSLVLFYVSRRMAVNGTRAEDFVTKGRLAQTFETLLVFLREEMTRPLLGKLTDRYIYFVWSVFFFILLGNVLGLIPFGAVFEVVGLPEFSHFGGTITGSITVTGGLALLALCMMFVIGLKENGFGFIKHMWPVPVTPPEGVKGPMLILVMPILWVAGIVVFALEFVGYFIKSFALCVRLFANMVAGHMVLGSLVIMAMSAPLIGKGASVLGAVAFSFLELFVAFLQAYIFTFLMVIFTSLGAVHHDEHDEHEGGLDEAQPPGEAGGGQLIGTHAATH